MQKIRLTAIVTMAVLMLGAATASAASATNWMAEGTGFIAGKATSYHVFEGGESPVTCTKAPAQGPEVNSTLLTGSILVQILYSGCSTEVSGIKYEVKVSRALLLLNTNGTASFKEQVTLKSPAWSCGASLGGENLEGVTYKNVESGGHKAVNVTIAIKPLYGLFPEREGVVCPQIIFPGHYKGNIHVELPNGNLQIS